MNACPIHQPQPPSPAGELDLRRLINEQRVLTHFQPLFSMRNQAILGVEALCRGVSCPDGSLISPQELFDSAGQERLLIDLDRLCRRQALKAFKQLSLERPGLILTLNFEAALLDMGVAGSGYLLSQVQQEGLDPSRIVIEIVESRVCDMRALEAFVEAHRRHGFLLALDDVGSGHSNLERIAAIQPDVLKIDRSLIEGLDRQYHKQEVTRALMNLAGKIGALVVAEGVEREEEALLALEMGVDVLQGFYLARPGPGAQSLEAGELRSRELALHFREYTVRKIAAKKAKHRMFDQIMASLAHKLREVEEEALDLWLEELVNQHPSLECLYVLDEDGFQISGTACQPARLNRQRGAIFCPASRGADQSLKNYYLLLKAGLERYVSEPYISRASGNLCLTISTWFGTKTGRRMVLCADFEAEAAH